MDGFKWDEWGATALGFLGFFFGVGFLVLGMLPVWVILIPLLVLFGILLAATAAVNWALAHLTH